MAKARMSVCKITGAILFTLIAASLSWGQMPDIPDKGFRPFGSYQLSDIDSVNLTNGNLILHIPIVSYPQRGNVPPLSLSLRYNNPRWSVKFRYAGKTSFGEDVWFALWGDDGSGLEIVRDNTYSLAAYVYNLYLIDPGPGTQALHVVDSMGAHHIVEDTSGNPSQGNTMESIDGTGLKVLYASRVIDGNGVRHLGEFYQVDHPTPPDNAGNEDRAAYDIASDNGFAESTEDSNGNKITPQFGAPSPQRGNTTPDGPVVSGWTDTMGRFIPAPRIMISTPCETLNFPGSNGGTAPITICYGSNGTAIRSSFGLSNVFDGNYDNAGFAGFPGIASITLPNGTSWQFHYNNFGFISSISLPTGGTISYTWQVSPQCARWLQGERNVGGTPQWHGETEVCDFIIASRTFNANDGSAPQTWTYSGDNGGGLVTVTDPLGNDTIHTFSAAYNTYTASYETKTQYYNGPQANNQLLKTVDRQYQNINSPGCNSDEGEADSMVRGPAIVPLSTTTTWAATNQVSQSTFTYDSGASVFVSNYQKVETCPLVYGKVIQESEYDYGTGAPLRTTNTQYQWQVDGNYLQNNLLNLPHSVQVTDGSVNQVAYSYNEYDQSGLQPSGVSSAQFDTNPPGAPYRGNLTTAHHWLNTSGTYLNTSTSYYDTGMPYQETDAKGNTTTLFYDPAFAGAYVTKMQMPTTTSTGVQHSISAWYDFNTGLKTSSTDQNQQTTNYTFDIMGRVTSITGPPDPVTNQSAQTTNCYTDIGGATCQQSGPPLQVVTSKAITASQNAMSTSVFDGLGRVVQTQLNSDPDGVTSVDTIYDALGRVHSVSNPHRASPSSTDGITQYQYDALGRVKMTIPPDGTLSADGLSCTNCTTTDYSQFPIVTVTDEAGKQRRNQTDALGRLLEVDEPGGSPASAAGGSLSINGTLQSFSTGPLQASSGHIELTFSGTLLSKASCSPSGQACSDGGSISITVAGFTKSVNYPYPGYTGTDSGGSVQALANAFHSDTTSPVDAIYYGADESGNIVMDLIARTTGAATNYPLSTSIVSNNPANFPSPSFQVSAGSHLIGGQDASSGGTIYDSGIVYVAVSGLTASAPYGQNGNNTAALIASALAGTGPTSLNAPNSPVTATASGSTIMLTAKTAGAAGNNLSASVSSSSYAPDNPSFASPGTTLSGGADAQPLLLSTPAVTLYSYDTLDNLLCVEQHGNVSGTGCSGPPSSDASSPWRVRRFTYDSLSRLLTATNPESGTICYGQWQNGQCVNGYDGNGNLLRKTSPPPNQTSGAPLQTTFYYDELNRLTGKCFSDSTPCESLYYDYPSVWNYMMHNPIGRLVATGVSSNNANTLTSYDMMGRPEWQVELRLGAPLKTFNYSYNLDGSLKSITYPSGREVDYSYNAAQRPVTAFTRGTSCLSCQASNASGINFASNAHYTAAGALSSVVNGNTSSFAGITTTDSYNSRLQPCRITASSTGVVPASCTDQNNVGNVLDLTYDFGLGQYDNGNVAQLINNKDAARTQQFGYDALNRLSWGYTPNLNSGGYHNWWEGFTYDNWGNLLAKNAAGGDTPLNLIVNGVSTVNSKNQGGQNWCYDAAGNVVGPNNPCSTYANKHTAYENVYDGENRLTQTTTGAGTTSYGYDAVGQRVKKSNGSTGTLYWQGLGGVLEETDLSGTLQNEYIFFGGKRVARYSATNGYSYYFTDHLGSADVVTDASGNIKEESDYYPFGGERVVTDLGIGNNYKFTGKERDPETGCDYFGARYYCNPIGRFITPDWAASPTAVPYAHFGNPQSLNLYSYVQNNPTTFGDPDGHQNLIALSTGTGFIFRCDACNQNAAQMYANPKQYAIGAAKAAGSFAYHIGMFAAGPVGITIDHFIGEPKGLKPTNATQAAGKTGTSVLLTLGSLLLPGPKGASSSEEVLTAARGAADAAQAQGRTSGAAAALKIGDQIFTDVSIGKGGTPGPNNPIVQQALDNVPLADRSPYHGGCAEIGCFNQALNDGVSPAGGTIGAAKIRAAGNPGHGQPLDLCPSCANVADQLGAIHAH